jgi:hypothetical protein
MTDMDKVSQRIEPILQHAEQELREVIADAAKNGDYDAVDLARDVAARIKAMLPLVVRRAAPGQNGKPSSPALHTTGVGAPAFPRSRTGKKGAYPRFLVRKGLLWKYGWSKSDKKEYIHKVPKDVFEQTIAAIATLTQNGVSPLAADQIVQQIELAGHAIPVYQVYVSLAFLRDRDVIQRNGRDGYVVVPDFAQRTGEAWSEG